MYFTSDLGMYAFFGLGDPFEHHSKLWHLVSGSYWKNQLSSPAITQSINSGSAPTCSSISKQTLIRASRCCSVIFLGILAQIFLIPNSSVTIKRTVSGSCSVHQQSYWLLIFDRIEQVLLPVLCCHLPVFLVVRCAAQLQQRFCLQKNILCKRKACALNIASSPKASWSFPCVVVAFLPSLSQKQWHTAAQCSVLPFSTTWFTNMSWHVKHLLRAEEL